MRGLAAGYVIEYPLQGLSGLAAGVAAALAGAWPAAVTASPEASLEEVGVLARALAAPRRASRRRSRSSRSAGSRSCTRATCWAGRKGSTRRPAPTSTSRSSSRTPRATSSRLRRTRAARRIFNARVTNLAPNLDELREAGVATFLVEQAAMDAAERAAFASGGLEALAPLASRERSTTGHLFRGVA